MQSLRIFILFGAPGSGKSHACEILKKISNENIRVIQKETTRAKRTTDGDEIRTVQTLSKKCDFIYNQYEFDYGFSSRGIWNNFREGFSSIIIVNDIRTIKLLNKIFGDLSHNIYLHSDIDKDKIIDLIKERHLDKDNMVLKNEEQKRIEKIKTVHRKYIENTHLFHTSIINIYDEKSKEADSELERQLEQMVNKSIFANNRLTSTARILIVSAGSFTGKDQLVNAMIQIEPQRVVSYQKGTTRLKKEGDNNELLHLAELELTEKYDLIYENNDHKYGLCSQDIWGELAKGKIVLIVLSDLEMIEKMKQIFSIICSVIYMHANIDEEELEIAESTHNLSESELLKRKNSIAVLHQKYIENINLFDHVLLNTSEIEDLYDQAFNVLDYYLGN